MRNSFLDSSLQHLFHKHQCQGVGCHAAGKTEGGNDVVDNLAQQTGNEDVERSCPQQDGCYREEIVHAITYNLANAVGKKEEKETNGLDLNGYGDILEMLDDIVVEIDAGVIDHKVHPYQQVAFESPSFLQIGIALFLQFPIALYFGASQLFGYD